MKLTFVNNFLTKNITKIINNQFSKRNTVSAHWDKTCMIVKC